MPKAFTQHEKELIKQRLLGQGHTLFSTYGLKKTNVEEIAKASGISKGAFYKFFDSKEELFMDVLEQAEIHLRQEILAVIDLPGPSPRARLFAVLKKAFSLFKTMPILQFLTGSDYDLLFRRIPTEKLQEHLTSDQAFFVELTAHCQEAGIPIRAQPDQIGAMLYPLVLTVLHEDNFGQKNLSGGIDLLLEVVAAFCLGEVEIQLQQPINPTPISEMRGLK
jgi:AcrR family transcriptional regulator